MKKLVLDPKKISFKKKDINYFLGSFFLNLIPFKKKANYVIINKEDISLKKQNYQINYAKKIYKEILAEIIPKLNKIHNIKWSHKTWNFFLGHWIHNYIAIILDRLFLIKPILKKKIDFSEQLSLGKNASLITNDLRHFTEIAGHLDWNNKLISRLIYLLLTKDFNNNNSLENSKLNLKTKKDNFFNIILFKFRVYLLNFLYSFFFIKKPFFIYNSYIKDKFKLIKIILSLGSLPLPFSFAFFNSKIIFSPINLNLRKEININYKNEKKIHLKIIKFLFVECFPTIYLEGFNLQKKISDNSHFPKKVSGVFTASAYTDNSFKFWLADKLEKKSKIYFGSHGVSYNIRKNNYHEEEEVKISKKYFIWGKIKNDKKMINVGNFLVNSNIHYDKSLEIKKYLIVLHVYDFYKRYMTVFFSKANMEDAKQINNMMNYFKDNIKSKIHIRPHPQDFRREFSMLNFIKSNNKSIKILKPSQNFQKFSHNYHFLIFTYLSTEFMNSLTLNKPCMVYINKNEFSKYTTKAKYYFLKLHSAGIVHFSGNSLSKKLNMVSRNLDVWWNSPKIIKIKKQFCESYCDPNFNYKIIISNLKKN